MKKPIISWQTPEFFDINRSSDWFWAIGIIASAIIITAVILNNVLLAIFFVIATITIFIHAKRKPEIINVEISENGIRAGKNMYPYSLLKSFYIEENPPFTRLMLKSSSVLNPIVIIPTINADLEKIREELSHYLEEEEINEPLSQKLLEYLGF